MEYFIFPENFKSFNENENVGLFNMNFQILDYNQKQITEKLNDIQQTLNNNYTYIKEQDIFSFLFNLITEFEDKKKDYILSLPQVSQILQNAIQKILQDINQENQEVIACYRMVFFLICFVCNQVKQKSQKNNIDEMVKEKKTKQTITENIISCQKSLIIILKESLQFKQIKKLQTQDPDFYKYFLIMLVNILENSNSLSDQQHFNNLIQCFIDCLECKKVDLKSIYLKFKFVLIENEENFDNLIQFIISSYQNENLNLRAFMMETIKLIAQTMAYKKNVGNEHLNFKNTQVLLTQLSLKIPRFFNQQLSYFICLYDSESYNLRIALNEILGNIIRLVLTNSGQSQDHDNLDQNNENKIRLLDILFQRIRDKNSYARSNILQIFGQILCENAFPFEKLQIILDFSCERIQDVSAHVRKHGLKCLQILVKLYYSIFVESQQQSKFLTIEQTNDQIEEINQQIKIFQQKVQHIIDQIQALVEEQIQEMDILVADKSQFERQIEELNDKKSKMNDYLAFLKQIDNVLPIVIQTLGSKSVFDCVESMKLLMIMNKYNIQNSNQGIKKMLCLIWSKEKTVKDEIIYCYHSLYLNTQEYTPLQIAQNLIQVMNDSDLNDVISLEELIQIMLSENADDKKTYKIPKLQSEVYKELWSAFNKGIKNPDEAQNRTSALQLIRIISSKNRDWLLGKVELLISIIKQISSSKIPDFVTIKEICKISEYLNQQNQDRFKDLIQNLIATILKFQGTEDNSWFCAIEQLINTLYNIKYSFEQLSEFMLQELSTFMYQENNDNYEMKLSQLIFAIGQISIKYLLMTDDLENLLVKIKNEREQKNKNNINPEEDELNKIDGGLDAEFNQRQKLIQDISEQCIVNKNMISQYLNIIINVCREVQSTDFKSSILARSAVMTMTKLMVISPEFCKQHIQFIVQFLNQENIDVVIKHNIIIVLGDLLHRHPNIVQPYSNYIYVGLKDPEYTVRKTCVMVITHLILNDMLKVSADISELAKLFEDKEQSIRELIHLFFFELYKKDNKTIYNLLTDFLRKLSSDDVEEEQFQYIAKNILQYIDKDKDKLQESMIEKLCQRFKIIDSIIYLKSDAKETHNTSYCLTLMTYSDKGIRKLLDCFDSYKNSLKDKQIYENFQMILKQLKKKKKQEEKNILEEWENKLNDSENPAVQESNKKKKPDLKIKKKKQKRNDSEDISFDQSQSSQQIQRKSRKIND